MDNDGHPVPMIRLQSVSVHYGQLCALEGVDLIVRENDFLGIVGPNGGGKSTLLKVILGVIKPTKGVVRICGDEPNTRGHKLGYVPQFTEFDKSFPISAKEVVLTGKLKSGLKACFRYSQQDKEEVNQLLNDLGIFTIRNRQISHLSGGQLQKVLIARALAGNPRLLLLDEPIANVDPEYKRTILSTLRRLNENMTILIVTHDLNSIDSELSSLIYVNQRVKAGLKNAMQPASPEVEIRSGLNAMSYQSLGRGER